MMSTMRDLSEPRKHRERKALLTGETQGGFREEAAFEMSFEGESDSDRCK